MTVKEILAHKLEPALLECDRHLMRLKYAAAKAGHKFPMNAETYKHLRDEEVTNIDQMLFRFGKLQDTMGQRLFPALLQAGQEWLDTETFLDKLNRLEKLGAIDSAAEWVDLREMRNGAMHEYPDQPEINAESLNKIFSSIPRLERTLGQATQFAREHYPIQRSSQVKNA